MMPHPSLPPEITEHIINFLRDDTETLKYCSLVSKSWVLLSRKHLFCEVVFSSLDDFEAWKKIFPDPVNSPARFTRFLHISCARVIHKITMDESGWVQAFSNVVRLKMWEGTRD